MKSLFVCSHLMKWNSRFSASAGKGSASIAWMKQSKIQEDRTPRPLNPTTATTGADPTKAVRVAAHEAATTGTKRTVREGAGCKVASEAETTGTKRTVREGERRRAEA